MGRRREAGPQKVQRLRRKQACKEGKVGEDTASGKKKKKKKVCSGRCGGRMGKGRMKVLPNGI